MAEASAELKALAQQIAEIVQRLTALESGTHDSFAPTNTYAYTAGGIKNFAHAEDEMLWSQIWNSTDEYEPGDVVVYHRRLYIANETIEGKESELTPTVFLPGDELPICSPDEGSPVGLLSPDGDEDIEVGGILTDNDIELLQSNDYGTGPPFLRVQFWQFDVTRDGPESEIEIPIEILNQAGDPVEQSDTTRPMWPQWVLFNDKGEQAGINTTNMVGIDKSDWGTDEETKTFYLGIAGGLYFIEPEHPEHEDGRWAIALPLGYSLIVKTKAITGGALVESLANEPPGKDYRWELVTYPEPEKGKEPEPGPWEPLTTLENFEEHKTEAWSLDLRHEPGGSASKGIVRLRGVMVCTSGIGGFEGPWLKDLDAGFRPGADVYLDATVYHEHSEIAEPVILRIQTNGNGQIYKTKLVEIASGDLLYVDGLTYSLD